jgi:hypothetical protein
MVAMKKLLLTLLLLPAVAAVAGDDIAFFLNASNQTQLSKGGIFGAYPTMYLPTLYSPQIYCSNLSVFASQGVQSTALNITNNGSIYLGTGSSDVLTSFNGTLFQLINFNGANGFDFYGGSGAGPQGTHFLHIGTYNDGGNFLWSGALTANSSGVLGGNGGNFTNLPTSGISGWRTVDAGLIQLSSGVATVSSVWSAATSTNVISVTPYDLGGSGANQAYTVSNVVVGTSFDIRSSSAGSTNWAFWQIENKHP